MAEASSVRPGAGLIGHCGTRLWTSTADLGAPMGLPASTQSWQPKGVAVGRKRVARLMRQARIQGVHRRRKVATTRQNPERLAAPDLVRREFTATGPNHLWVADITYIPTKAGFLYLAAVIDVWSRRVVGWSMRNDLTTPLVTDALDMALAQRKPDRVIDPLNLGNTPRGRSGPAATKPASRCRWDAEATPTTTQ